ncbi:MAG TPA: zinc-binding dehydrogenase [Candidatus Dormibacteraeota bacterium]|nr:zinc-binding dehydrogenase [Candidatus Dormibacteraeota bacterium]
MRAAVISDKSGPAGVAVKEWPDPQAGPGEVLVRLRAAALNRRDYFITVGLYPRIALPCVAGSDGAGEVLAVGEGVTRWKAGDRVVILPEIGWGDREAFPADGFRILGMPDQGTFAEHIVVGTDCLYPMPAHLDFEHAAALPLAGLTAYRAVVSKGAVSADEWVLATGIGGGVQTLALQFAKALGAKVVATSRSDAKLERAKQLGADAVFNISAGEWSKAVREATGGAGVALAVDSVGGETFAEVVKATGNAGRIVCYGATLGNWTVPAALVFFRQIRIEGTTMGSPRDFAQMLRLVEREKIVPAVDHVFPLEQIGDALGLMERSEQFGKIVLRIA